MGWKKYLVEFIGTFFLMATIGFTVLEPGSAGDLAPLAIGSALMVMVYAGGHISGRIHDPAVTLAVWIRGKCPLADVPGYILAQVLGAAAAAFVVMYVKQFPPVEEMVLVPNYVLVAEALFTFALCYVVLNAATAKGTAGNSFYGLAIGFTVLTGAFAVGSVSGGVFNPAVAVGVTMLGLSTWANIWMFLIAQFTAGALAALVFRLLNPDDKGD